MIQELFYYTLSTVQVTQSQMRQQNYYIQKARLFLAKNIYFNIKYLFLYGLFNNGYSSSYYTAQNGMITVNAALESIWTNLKNHPSICLKGLWNTMKILVSITVSGTRI
jgi:hypothetical protein